MRAWRNTRGERLLLAEALFCLLWAKAAVRWVPFSQLAGGLGRFKEESPPSEDLPDEMTARAIQAAIRRVSARLPGEASCLVRALAAQRMLKRRRVPSTFYLGVTREGGTLQGHAWLRTGREIVTGGEQAAAHATVSTFGWRPPGRQG